MKIKIFTLLVSLAFLLQNCSSQDPNYQYLLAIPGLVTATGTTSTATGTTSTATGTTSTATGTTTGFSVSINDVKGDPSFIFDTTRTITFLFIVVDPTVPNLAGNQLKIADSYDNNVLFKATLAANGSISGNFTINQTSTQVTVFLDYFGQKFNFNIDLANVQVISRYIFINGYSVASNYVPPLDTDGDGVPDSVDQYPTDATRSSTIRIPAASYYTVAFEDLYPNKGDADFNDYVVRVVNEVDLNGAGNVTYIRGNYQHVARGAGYKHNFRANITDKTGGTVTVTLSGGSSACPNATTTKTVADLKAIELFPGCDSSKTVIPKNGNVNSNTMANVKSGEVFNPGVVSNIEVKLDQPLAMSALGGAPFDIYLHVINTNKDIHFAGKFIDPATGKDTYLDSDGFPWALLIPGDWAWPLERARINIAYSHFTDWYLSLGKNFKDWYNTFNSADVFTK